MFNYNKQQRKASFLYKNATYILQDPHLSFMQDDVLDNMLCLAAEGKSKLRVVTTPESERGKDISVIFCAENEISGFTLNFREDPGDITFLTRRLDNLEAHAGSLHTRINIMAQTTFINYLYPVPTLASTIKFKPRASFETQTRINNGIIKVSMGYPSNLALGNEKQHNVIDLVFVEQMPKLTNLKFGVCEADGESEQNFSKPVILQNIDKCAKITNLEISQASLFRPSDLKALLSVCQGTIKIITDDPDCRETYKFVLQNKKVTGFDCTLQLPGEEPQKIEFS